MKRLILGTVLVAALAGCGKGPSEPARTATGDLTPVEGMSAYSLGEPIQSGDLTVVPVVYKSPNRQTDDYATLAEAMKNRWVEIIEMPGGEVNTLRVRNTGPKPLLLLGGELLIGGKQDRVVSKDVIIKPGATVDVEVNCVEHGRWQGSSLKFDDAKTMVPLSVRAKANYEGQQEVWDRVGAANEAANPSDSRTTVQVTLGSDVVQKRISGDLGVISAALRNRKDVVGMILAYDGKPQTLEIFGSSSLFAASQDVILKGALAEVALSPNASTSRPSMDDFKAFFVDCLNGNRKLRGQAGGMNTFSAESPTFRGAEIATPDYEAKPSAKQDGLVHGTYTRNAGQ